MLKKNQTSTRHSVSLYCGLAFQTKLNHPWLCSKSQDPLPFPACTSEIATTLFVPHPWIRIKKWNVNWLYNYKIPALSDITKAQSLAGKEIILTQKLTILVENIQWKSSFRLTNTSPFTFLMFFQGLFMKLIISA